MPNRATTVRNRAAAAKLFSTENILAVYAAATPTDKENGKRWYSIANAAAQDLAETYNLSLAAAAGIIAALSPQEAWESNLLIATEFCESGALASVHTTNACDKASRIFRNSNAAEHEVYAILGGNKVRSFFRNILFPLTAGPVTIDRHACAILLGTDTPTFNTQYGKILERKHYYRCATAYYRAAARELGLLPQELQAITWLVQSKRSSSLPTF